MLSMDYFFSKEMVADKVGFELGYFSIFDDDKILYDGKRKQNFMLFLSIPDILLDLCDLIESKKKKKDIILADSSVIMSFLNKNGKIELRINDIFIFEEKSREVIKVFYASSTMRLRLRCLIDTEQFDEAEEKCKYLKEELQKPLMVELNEAKNGGK